jgi:RHS repeat-associated protein
LQYQFGGYVNTAGASAGTMDNFSMGPIAITKPGYIYVYLSFECTTIDYAFFDDLNVEIRRSVIQADDYYPFGLTFNSYTRSYSTANNYKYNGKELQPETQWYDYGARMYDPAIARFINVDPLADNRDWLTPYNYVQNNSILRIDPTGAIDDYYDIEGNYLGNDGQGDNLRLVKEGQEQAVASKLNGAQTTEADRNAARSSDNSAVITIDPSVQTTVQNVSDQSLQSGLENQAVILLDIYSDNPTITAQPGPVGTNGETELTTVVDGGKRYDPNTGQLVIGQVHGHPKTNDPGKVNVPGTSTTDQNTSTSTGIPIYAVDSYSGSAGRSQNIHRANPNPSRRRDAQTKNVGKTGSFNIGRDALEIHGRKRDN